MQKISILGCGWLGLPLAETLILGGYAVKGSTTSPEKIEMLESCGIKPFVITLHENGIDGEIELFLEGCDWLIIDFPPKLRTGTGESFLKKINNLVPYIEKAQVPNVIFISSTSVYADGESIVTEETLAMPLTESGKQLLAAENLLLSKDFLTTIIRFGGLIGNDRHPVFHLAGKTDLENPKSPINLIHLSDCIGIIDLILKKQPGKIVFNAVAPFHPSREMYYQMKASALHLEKPIFKTDSEQSGKLILSDKLITLLDYQFKVTGEI
ncbi:NAD(P)H-binding protein [Flavobacterium sp.]|uniref:NAD(P)H-binding protein n=1 Tax=Flavobacterium sp. TaxID=239 RepID=UPI002637C061|nr:NAD(P)H-binding protein [Flavobacterium sp.]